LEEVAAFPDQQVTGVGVSRKSGRVFVNFPYWSSGHSVSVAEIVDGKPVAFPDTAWNEKEGDATKRFVCVQSVVVDDMDRLWILDTGSPLQKGVVKGGAKVVQVDLSTNKVAKTYPIDEDCAPEKSYLNDIRIDTASGHAFITESGIGSLVVLELKSGKARRFLANHPSTKAEAGKEIVVDGIKPIDPVTGGTPTFHADGIALDVDKDLLYYHALTGQTLYQIATGVLTSPEASDKEAEAAVVKVDATDAPDGMLETPDGGVLLAAFEKNAIVRFDPHGKKSSTLVEDPRLQWLDTLAWGPEGWLYLTTSQIHRTPKYNGGKSLIKEPFRIYRLKAGTSE
jgi:sugar lactone lactonase YvrE